MNDRPVFAMLYCAVLGWLACDYWRQYRTGIEADSRWAHERINLLQKELAGLADKVDPLPPESPETH